MLAKGKGGVKAPMKGNSAKMNTSVGSGSRPGKSRMPIQTSAPAMPHKLGRAPAGALK